MSKKCELLGVGVMSGNKVSHSNRKTRRRFLPNLKAVSFKSETLGTEVTLKVAASTLRTVNKHGNIDNFLINCRYAKLTDSAKKLRTKIKKKLIALGKFEEVKAVRAKKAPIKSARKLRAEA